jgi:hypothetical protein
MDLAHYGDVRSEADLRMAYKQKNDAERLKALAELAAQAQELNMGY